MNYIPNEIEDELIRDLTQVVPRSKSEVRRRINEYAVSAFKAGQKDMVEKMLKKVDDLYSIEGRFDGSADNDHIQGYRIALKEITSSLEELIPLTNKE